SVHSPFSKMPVDITRQVGLAGGAGEIQIISPLLGPFYAVIFCLFDFLHLRSTTLDGVTFSSFSLEPVANLPVFSSFHLSSFVVFVCVRHRQSLEILAQAFVMLQTSQFYIQVSGRSLFFLCVWGERGEWGCGGGCSSSEYKRILA
uniref:Uncharacterized protein n=1 Tax=Parascaris univalens TaxID=6257 RepID=A0A915B498_PARUN